MDRMLVESMIVLISVIVDSKGMGTILFAMTVTGWCPTARIVRSQMLGISQSDYVLAARLMDVSPFRIILEHLIPNTMSVIIVDATFRVPGFIFSEAFLSYVASGSSRPGQAGAHWRPGRRGHPGFIRGSLCSRPE